MRKKKKLHILWNYNVTNVTYTICYPLLRDNNNRKEKKTGQIPITHHIHEFPAMISIQQSIIAFFISFYLSNDSISFFAFTFLRLSSRKKWRGAVQNADNGGGIYNIRCE